MNTISHPDTYYNPERDIFVEIAPRQSGKTTRLLRNIKEWLDGHITRSACLMTHRYLYSKSLVEIHLFEYRDRIFILDDHRMLENTVSYMDSTSNMFYFDEFDLIINLPIVDNSYYTSTIVHSSLISNTLFNIVRNNNDVREVPPFNSLFPDLTTENEDDLYLERCGI